MEIIVGASTQAAAELAARWMARRIRSAVRLRGTCSLAVSGGGTPNSMFDVLATMDLPWKQVHLFQVDERIAPDSDSDRNATDLEEHLVRHVSIPKRNVHLMPVTAVSAERAAARYAASVGSAPLDIVHLGVGDDGHTASWPPGDPVVDNASPVAVTDVFNGRKRMTLTPSVVNGARARMLLAVGKSKAGPLADWVTSRGDLPINRVKRTSTTLIVDSAAAAKLLRR